MKILNYIMAAMFLFSVVVQYNDPDPQVWMSIYGAALVVCVLEILGRNRWCFSATVGVITLVWALTLVSQVLGKVAFSELFEAWEMKDQRVEVAREMGGLLIVAFWMAVLTAVQVWRMKRSE
jgi:hypothetical protein